MTQEEGALAELAAKLTGAQRAILKRTPTSWGNKLFLAMLGLGIACRDPYGLPVLTPLGLRLRAFLTQPEGE